MTYFFLDTETAGLPTRPTGQPGDLSHQPRLVQLAWATYVTDTFSALPLFAGQPDPLLESSHLIRPVGFTIPEDAARIHGITTERALVAGIDLGIALTLLADALGDAHVLVGHNLTFDEAVLAAEYQRLNRPSPFRADLTRMDTMRLATPLCQLPGKYGFKWPKLAELHQHLFDADFPDAHDAAADVRACAVCFFELQRRGVVR
jgi:DNA polymerase-3 subunit epsilon